MKTRKYSATLNPFPKPKGPRGMNPKAPEPSVTKFPVRLDLTLSPRQREGMEWLAARVPHINDADLLGAALSRGIDAMRQEAEGEQFRREREPEPASEMEHFAAAKSEVEVLNYLGFPISDSLRDKLREFLEINPEALPIEDACAMLLDMGVDYANAPVVGLTDSAHRCRARTSLLRVVLRA
jgi:hypothetical protein